MHGCLKKIPIGRSNSYDEEKNNEMYITTSISMNWCDYSNLQTIVYLFFFVKKWRIKKLPNQAKRSKIQKHLNVIVQLIYYFLLINVIKLKYKFLLNFLLNLRFILDGKSWIISTRNSIRTWCFMEKCWSSSNYREFWRLIFFHIIF